MYEYKQTVCGSYISSNSNNFKERRQIVTAYYMNIFYQIQTPLVFGLTKSVGIWSEQKRTSGFVQTWTVFYGTHSLFIELGTHYL